VEADGRGDFGEGKEQGGEEVIGRCLGGRMFAEVRLEHDCFVRKHHPFVPADAGTQFLLQSLGPRVRGDERNLMS
jgi:hypothetical protein